MKTRHFLLVGVLGIALAGVVLTGCKKKSTAPATDTTAAQDDANALFAIQDSKNISDGAAKGQANDRTMASSCETIRRILPDTVINSVHDSAIDIFFGNTNCMCNDYRNRRGHIIVYWNGKGYFDSAASIGMTFKNYYVNDMGITGTRTLTNIGKDSAGLHTWGFNANLTLTYPNGGGTATWNSTRTNTLEKIGGVYYYSISGGASGTSRKSATYSINITSPIIVTALPWWFFGCRFIEAGKVTITVSTFSYPIYVTFGSAIGTCSSAMTATINNNTYNLTQL